MSAVYPHQVDYGKPTIGGLLHGSLFVNIALMNSSDESTPYAAIGRRLTAIRQAESSLNQKDWAEKHGFSPTQYNNWERGVRRISMDEADKLCEIYGLTLDFIYRGRLNGLPENIKNLL